jgi:diguanylate cyclase
VRYNKLYAAIGAFLTEHGLPPSPDNYALVYALFADERSAHAVAVRAATGDGVRLTQREADRIKGEFGLPVSVRGVDPVLLAAARRRADEFATIVEAQRAEAENYSRDLESGAAELEEAGGDSVTTLIEITRAMVERTRAAEQQLTVARDEAQALRVRLVAAGEEARSDPLTRLPNRRAFEERYAEIARSGIRASIAICDIDHFKQVNDTCGHGVGDRVLRMFADLLDAGCPGHMVARLGGEEFVVLFEGLNAAQSARILDSAREALAAKRLRVRETDTPIGTITFSAGIACGSSDSPVVPLQRADALLYEAKNAGRNQVRFEAA